eukprot:5583119-Ditylum_brightwellii.AAC.1
MEDMLEENRHVIKDTAKHKTYIATTFVSGEEEIIQEKRTEIVKPKPFCNLANCSKPKSHQWNTSKNADFMACSNKSMHIRNKIKKHYRM